MENKKKDFKGKKDQMKRSCIFKKKQNLNQHFLKMSNNGVYPAMKKKY